VELFVNIQILLLFVLAQSLDWNMYKNCEKEYGMDNGDFMYGRRHKFTIALLSVSVKPHKCPLYHRTCPLKLFEYAHNLRRDA